MAIGQVWLHLLQPACSTAAHALQCPTCSTASGAPPAAACSLRLSSPNVPPYFLRSPSRSPILGCAAKASNQPVTGVCGWSQKGKCIRRGLAAGRVPPRVPRRQPYLVPPGLPRRVDQGIYRAVGPAGCHCGCPGAAGATLEQQGLSWGERSSHRVAGSRQLAVLRRVNCPAGAEVAALDAGRPAAAAAAEQAAHCGGWDGLTGEQA